ncbi:MAG: hypothetical protein EOP34_06720 [Rickettsiales bacterium]|nr:MAG: hypothetical protein EOP34_06720 [Rickettsiales bacterium]
MKNRVRAIIGSISEYRPNNKLYALIYSAVIMLLRIIYILLNIICKIPRWSFIIIMGTVKYVSILLSLFAITICKYNTNILSLYAFEYYSIGMGKDNNKLLDISARILPRTEAP